MAYGLASGTSKECSICKLRISSMDWDGSEEKQGYHDTCFLTKSTADENVDSYFFSTIATPEEVQTHLDRVVAKYEFYMSKVKERDEKRS